jgi:hypothetical protein
MARVTASPPAMSNHEIEAKETAGKKAARRSNQAGLWPARATAHTLRGPDIKLNKM